jgi:hypothetical protein
MWGCFTVGDIVRPGETISSESLSRRAGGKGANQAVAVANAGGKVTLVGAIGKDGAWVKDQLMNFGVGVEQIRTVEVSYDAYGFERCSLSMKYTTQESTGRAIIQLAESGENSISARSFVYFHTNLLTYNASPLQRCELRVFSCTHDIGHCTLLSSLATKRDPL